jgi:hypothetical protein
MRLAVIAVSLALVLLCSTANGGAVQIGLVNGSEFDKWNSGGPVAGLSRTKSRCENAKFDETSMCDTVVITNGSNEAVRVTLQMTGSGFEKLEPPNQPGSIALAPGVFYSCGPTGEQRTIDNRCDTLEPGHSCYQNIEFSPRDSGTSTGHIEIRVTGSGAPIPKSYELVATAEYPPDLAAADQVRKAHLDELMRIPHVVRVSLDNSGDEIVIQIEVAHEEDIQKVERQVPSKLDSYPVEVIQKIEEGWGF